MSADPATADWDKATLLTLRAQDGQADLPEVSTLIARLHREMVELDVEAVEPGARGSIASGHLELMALGTRIVAVARSEVVGAFVSAVRSWLGGQRPRQWPVIREVGRDVSELSGLSSAEQRRAVDGWLDRREGRWAPGAAR